MIGGELEGGFRNHLKAELQCGEVCCGASGWLRTVTLLAGGENV